MAEFKRPESVLVVVHTPRLECLLLERVAPKGFWQSVTGTLRWRETPAVAAVREVREETGLDCAVPDSRASSAESGEGHLKNRRPAPVLVETGITRRFPIRPEWQDRYRPGVTDNLEHLFYLEIPKACSITLNADEHVAYRWMGLEQAIERVASWTNRDALERLRASRGNHQNSACGKARSERKQQRMSQGARR